MLLLWERPLLVENTVCWLFIKKVWFICLSSGYSFHIISDLIVVKIGTSRSHPHFLWIIFKIHNNILGLWGHQYLGWLSIWIWPLLLASAEGQNLRLTMLPWSFAKSQTAWIYFKISSFYSLDKDFSQFCSSHMDEEDKIHHFSM